MFYFYLAKLRLLPLLNSSPVLTEPPASFGLNTLSMFGNVVTVLQFFLAPTAKEIPRYCSRV